VTQRARATAAAWVPRRDSWQPGAKAAAKPLEGGRGQSARPFLTRFPPCSPPSAARRPYSRWLEEHALSLAQLTASVPPEARVPPPLPGARPLSALLPAAATPAAADNGAAKPAASNIVAFTPPSSGAAAPSVAAPAVACELDAGVQSLLKPLKVGPRAGPGGQGRSRARHPAKGC
jgi:hypothetical protein